MNEGENSRAEIESVPVKFLASALIRCFLVENVADACRL